MSTIIYPSPIFGPVHSRRLGISLGINLMPADGKVCTFDCIYCECGFNKQHVPTQKRPTREEVATQLEAKLREMHAHEEFPDVLTFAGNGEPTGHPDFKISVLSNSTFIFNDSVREALMKVDNNILKVDTVDMDYIRTVDRPLQSSYDIHKIIEGLKLFKGHVIIQSMFMKGKTEDGIDVDNTQEQFVDPWLQAVKSIRPQEVMIYTIDRETPDHALLKATHEELDAIRDRVIAEGIPCTASY